MASRFIVGQIELTITNSCSIAIANHTVLNYTTTTNRKFSGDGLSMSINVDALQLM
jgi:hypothetical protein